MAHPDLAGRLGVEELTEDSRKEQAGVGLDRLSKEEFELFTGLNEAYRGLFGFPFIICVGKTDKPGILACVWRKIVKQPGGRASDRTTGGSRDRTPPHRIHCIRAIKGSKFFKLLVA